MPVKSIWMISHTWFTWWLGTRSVSSHYWGIPLQWHHNGCDGVSNHRRIDCLLSRLFRRRSKKTSKLRVTSLCEGIHRWPTDSPHKGSVTREMFAFDDIMRCIYESHLPRRVKIIDRDSPTNPVNYFVWTLTLQVCMLVGYVAVGWGTT